MLPLFAAFLMVMAPLHPPPDSCGAQWKVGESLRYRVSLTPFGRVGRASFRVLGPDSLAVADGVVFAFDLRASVLFMGTDKTYRSWYDPEDGRSRAYVVTEQRGRDRLHEKDVRIDKRGHWRDAATGEEGQALHEAPLDELSFLYVVRQLPLDDGDELTLFRHYREADNPVRITVRGREILRVDDRDVPVIRLEVRFQPRRLFDGGGRSTLLLANDATRRLVRMQVDLPIAGHLRLDLEPEMIRVGCNPVEDQPKADSNARGQVDRGAAGRVGNVAGVGRWR